MLYYNLKPYLGKRYTYQEVDDYISSLNLKIKTPEKEYKGATQKITIICKCGNTFQNTFSLLKYGVGLKCRICVGLEIAQRNFIPYEEIKNRIENQSECILATTKEQYSGTKNKISLVCKCGDFFSTTYHEFTSNNKKQCNKCGKNMMTMDKLKLLLLDNSISNGAELISFESSNGYILNTSRLKMKCQCGNEFNVKRDSLLKSGANRCRKCSSTYSKGEESVELILKRYKVNYKKQHTFEDCKGKVKKLPFDFAVFTDSGDIDFLIEYDGRQHFEPIEAFGGSESFRQLKNNDSIKNMYTAKNKIRLLRISYKEQNDIEQLILDELKKYGFANAYQ